MSKQFTIDLLPAHDGDCLWVEWGEDGRNSRMLIDGGRGGSDLAGYLRDAFAARPPSEHVFDLVVSTHMDADHIAGLIGLMRDPPATFSTKEIWFNAFRHLPPDDVLGWKQSDRLEELVDRHVTATDTVWNDRIGCGGAVMVEAGPVGTEPPPLPTVTIDGLKITLLSPTLEKLKKVARKWPKEVREAGLALPPEGDLPEDDPTDDPDDDTLGFDEDKGVEPSELAIRGYRRDTSAANGASIAFIAAYEGKRVLFAGDAHAEVLQETLRRYQPDGPISLDAFKLSHHGSEKNLSPDLLDLVECRTWLVSSNGNIHKHPDRRAISRIVARSSPAHLVFNYGSRYVKDWGKNRFKMAYDFDSYLPPEDEPGVRYDVLADTAVALPRADGPAPN